VTLATETKLSKCVEILLKELPFNIGCGSFWEAFPQGFVHRLLTLFPYACIMGNRLLSTKEMGEKLGLDPGQARRL